MNRIMLRAYRQATNIRIALDPISGPMNKSATRIINRMDRVRFYIDKRYNLGYYLKGA